MDLGLRGRVALVAAASKGLGRAVAAELAAEGADLVVCARGADALHEAARSFAAAGVQVEAVVADLSEPADVARVVDAAHARFGRVDVLVTNTGGPPAGPFESHSPDVWQRAVQQNLHSVLNLVRGVLPGMKARRWGRILNVTSMAVKQPVDDLILSNSIRAAVTGFARTLATEVAPFGVTVNNVLPGYHHTLRVDQLAERTAAATGGQPRDVVARWEGQIPMGRLGDPGEFAAVVAFLASARASYVTAQSIVVDGGFVRALL